MILHTKFKVIIWLCCIVGTVWNKYCCISRPIFPYTHFRSLKFSKCKIIIIFCNKKCIMYKMMLLSIPNIHVFLFLFRQGLRYLKTDLRKNFHNISVSVWLQKWSKSIIVCNFVLQYWVWNVFYLSYQCWSFVCFNIQTFKSA